MNKKFLSAILFGALMVTSTGTFVSCKDYDDDIDRIDNTLNDLKSQIAALQSKIDAGKYITNVSTTADGITITLNDGTSYPISNGKNGEAGKPGEPGAAGDKIEVNEDGYFVINGEPTEWMAVKKDQLGQVVKVKTPTVSEDGCWVFYDEKGEAHPTTIKVAPVTAVENADKSWTLTVFDTKGGSQEITVPTAASSLTDLILVTRGNGSSVDIPKSTLSIAQYDFVYDKNTNGPDRNKWKGQRALPEDGYILAATSSLKLQVNPTKVDVADLDLKLVDSQENYASGIDLSASPYTGIEYFASSSRAASANGLYTLSIADKYFKKTTSNTELNNYWNQFKAYIYGNHVGAKAYAVTAGGNVRTKYEVEVAKSEALSLDYIYLINTETGQPLKFNNAPTTGNFQYYYLAKNASTTGTADAVDAKMEPNVWYQVYAYNSHALYDMHLVFSDDDETLFGIETKEENGIVAIRLTETPDNITKAGFKLTIQNVDNKGVYNQAQAWIGETSTITNEVIYDAITHKLSKNNDDKSKDKNFFQIDLTKMKEALGTNGLALWNTKVKRAEVAYFNVNGTKIVESSQIAETFVSELKENMKGNTEKAVSVGKSATNMIFAIDNVTAATKFEIGKQYTAVITFYDAATNGEKLNSIKVPFTFTLPAITDLFAIDPGFIKENVANCYLYNDDFKKVNTSGAATFKLSRIFSKYDVNGFTVKLNAIDKIGSTDKKSSELATLKSDAAAAANAKVVANDLAYLTLDGTLGEEKGYDQVLKLTIDGKFDNAWKYPSDAVFNFQVKVMSPIEKGKIVPKEGNVVKIKASDLNGYKFGNDVIIGYTYNTEVSYKVMPNVVKEVDDVNVNAWSRDDIAAVTGETGNKLYFEVTNGGKATPATTGKDANNKDITVEGGLILKGYQVDHTVDTTIKINVTDIWKRVKSSDVAVKITVGE